MKKINIILISKIIAYIILICQLIPSTWWTIFAIWVYSDIAISLPFPINYILLVLMFLIPLSFSIFSILYSKHFYSDNKSKKYISKSLFILNLLLFIFMIYFLITTGICTYPIFD